MEKQTTNVHYVIQLTIILVFFAILMFPLALMALDGPDTTALESEAATELVELTPDTYQDGSFHSAFESWFSKHYPLRSSIVTLYREMVYNLENSDAAVAVMSLLNGTNSTPSVPANPPVPTPPSTDAEGEDPDNDEPQVDPWAVYLDPDNIYATVNARQLADTPVEPTGFRGSDAVYIGKSGYLFERAYIDEYYGFTQPYSSVTEEGVATTVEKLEYIQEEAEARYGTTMLYILSSSKASQYADYIPEYYKNRYIINPEYVRGVDMMRPLLAESSLNYLDSSVYYQEIGLLNTFPKTGIHWNHIASFESTAKLLRMYSEITGETIKLPYAVGVNESTTPVGGGNSDVDVFNILYGQLGNVDGKIMDEFYYSPIVEVENPTAPRIDIFVQGGSFTGDIVNYVNMFAVGNVRRIYYNGTNNVDSWGSDSPWVKGPEIWEKILEMNDLIIFEQTEQQIRSGHVEGDDWANQQGRGDVGSNAVYDSLYQFLKDTE